MKGEPARKALTGISKEYQIVREHFASLPTRISFEIQRGDTPDIISRKIQIEINRMLQELELL